MVFHQVVSILAGFAILCKHAKLTIILALDMVIVTVLFQRYDYITSKNFILPKSS